MSTLTSVEAAEMCACTRPPNQREASRAALEALFRVSAVREG